MKKWLTRILVTIGLAASVLVPLAWAATTFTNNVCLPKPTPGDPSSQNTWGALINTGADIIDAITSQVTSISVAGSSNVVLTFNCGSLDQTDAAHFNFTGALTGNIYVLWPNTRNRTFSATNSTTGSFTLSLGANNGSAAPAGTTITLPQGYTGLFYSDGTNVVSRTTSGAITLSANSIPGNMTGSTAQGTDLALPNCSGGLTYSSGSGFGCGGGGGGGGGGLAWGGVQTSNFNAVANTIYCVDTSGGIVTMTLPGTPVAGNQVVFLDCASDFGANNLTVANNGNNLMGFNANMAVNLSNAGVTLTYSGVTDGWRMY